MLLLVFYLFLALFVSFLCSILESVLLSTSQTFLDVKKEEGHTSAETFIRLKNNIETHFNRIDHEQENDWNRIIKIMARKEY